MKLLMLPLLLALGGCSNQKPDTTPKVKYEHYIVIGNDMFLCEKKYVGSCGVGLYKCVSIASGLEVAKISCGLNVMTVVKD